MRGKDAPGTLKGKGRARDLTRYQLSFKGTEPGKTDPMIPHVFLKERVELSRGHFFDFAGSQSLSGYGSSKLQWRTSFSGHHLNSVLDWLN